MNGFLFTDASYSVQIYFGCLNHTQITAYYSVVGRFRQSLCSQFSFTFWLAQWFLMMYQFSAWFRRGCHFNLLGICTLLKHYTVNDFESSWWIGSVLCNPYFLRRQTEVWVSYWKKIHALLARMRINAKISVFLSISHTKHW